MHETKCPLTSTYFRRQKVLGSFFRKRKNFSHKKHRQKLDKGNNTEIKTQTIGSRSFCPVPLWDWEGFAVADAHPTPHPNNRKTLKTMVWGLKTLDLWISFQFLPLFASNQKKRTGPTLHLLLNHHEPLSNAHVNYPNWWKSVNHAWKVIPPLQRFSLALFALKMDFLPQAFRAILK